MLRIFFLLSMLITGAKLFAQPSDAPLLVKQGKDLIAAMNEAAALVKFKDALKSDPNNYEAAWNASFLCARIGNRQADEIKKKEYFVMAKQYAVKSLKLNPNDAESNFVMAVAMGRMALISGTKDKVAASRDIKYYADLALKYNPNHASAWHLLGKWNYEVANLSFAERAVASTLFGGIPGGASNEEAIRCYNKAIAIDPSYILYYLDLAVVYNNIEQKDKAVELLKKAVTLAPRTEDDPKFIQKCKDLLAEQK